MPWVWVDPILHTATSTASTIVYSAATIGPAMLQQQQNYAAYAASQAAYAASQAAHLQAIGRQERARRVEHPAVIRETQEAADRRARESRELWDAANERAEALLRGFLTEEQRATLDSDEYIDVLGVRGRYRIRRGKIANIDVLDRNDRLTHRLCVHPTHAYELPVADVMAAQLLHLRADEDRVLQIANRHPAPGMSPMTDRWLAAQAAAG